MKEVTTVGMLTITRTPKYAYSQELGRSPAERQLVDWNVLSKFCSICDAHPNSNFTRRSHLGGISVECRTCKASETFK